MRKEHTDLHADVSIRMTETLFFFTCGPLLFAQFALSLPVACGISGQKEDRKWRKCWRMRSRWKTEIDDLVPVLGFTNDPRFHFTEEHIMLTAGLAALSDRKMINVPGKPPLVFLPTLLPSPRTLDAEQRDVISWMKRTSTKTALVCFGTQANSSACGKVLRSCLKALHACGYSCVLITKQPFRADHRTFVVEKRLNGLHEVIQAADIVVNHGGAGIVMEALISGKPMLCVPFAYDQFNNAFCVEKVLSAGRTVYARVAATSVATVRRALRNIDDKGCHGHAQRHKDALLLKGRESLYDVLKATRLRHEVFFRALGGTDGRGSPGPPAL
jgi:hypothetical protein